MGDNYDHKLTKVKDWLRLKEEKINRLQEEIDLKQENFGSSFIEFID